MTIDLLNSTDRTNKVQKTFTTIQGGISGTMRHTLDELSPIFELQITQNTLSGAKYLYCSETNKYYHIEKTYPNKAFMVVECHEDVLSSFKDHGLMNLSVIASRSSNMWNLYLQDAGRQTQQNQNTYIKEFPNSFNDLSFVMITSGSYQNVQGGEV